MRCGFPLRLPALCPLLPPVCTPPAATVAKTAGSSSKGGVVWPPGQPADVKSGRLVFNTNIHGAVFNSAAGRQTLEQFLDKMRRNTAAVFPRTTFGRMVLSGGSGLRLVNDPAFPCACEGECNTAPGIAASCWLFAAGGLAPRH